MITLTLEECLNFTIEPINYENEEAKIRERNANMLTELVNLLRVKENLEILKSQNNIFTIPEEFKVFYTTYLSTENETVKDTIILSKIRKEYIDLMTKISNFAEKNNLNKENVLNEVMTHDMFRLTFSKDPGRQTFHQHFAASWLSQIPFIENLEEPPAGGKNAIYIYHGEIVSGKDKNDKRISKSVDMKWEYSFKDKVLSFFATHKYTKDLGGSQDNQYKDVQEFHTEAKECINNNYFLLSITDGRYYLSKEAGLSQNMSKIQYLNTGRFKGDRNCATNLNNIVVDIVPVIKNWLRNNFKEDEIREEIEKLEIIQGKCDFSQYIRANA